MWKMAVGGAGRGGSCGSLPDFDDLSILELILCTNSLSNSKVKFFSKVYFDLNCTNDRFSPFWWIKYAQIIKRIIN